MKELSIRQIASFCSQEITLNCWVTHVRHSGKLVFLEVRDGSGEIQCVVFEGDVSSDVFEIAKNLSLETSVAITGIVREDKRSKIGYEIGASRILVINHPEGEYPISPKEHGVAFLMEKRHLWLRSQKQRAIMQIRSTIIKSSRDYFDSQGFMIFDAPMLTPVACEGTTTLFETTYFNEMAYLTQSGQLYNEAGAMAFGKVYSFGPTFRAEKSKTRRHLTEFWMIEPEAAFFKLEQVMELAENYVAYIIGSVVAKNRNELSILDRDTSLLENITTPFPRLSYDEAISLIRQKGLEIEWGDDLGAEHETVLSSQFNAPVLVHRYPSACKAFYMKADPVQPELALCCDMLAPEGYGEIIGGGQREDSYDVLLKKIHDHNLNVKDFDWYLDLRKYGSVPHGGFGMGLERFIAWICGLHHVRETIPFPRMLDKIWP